MSIRCDIYDRKLYDIWFAAAPYAAKSKPAKTLRQWAADEGADIVCAAVTSAIRLVESTVNDVMGLCASVKVREKDAKIIFRLPGGLSAPAESTCQNLLTGLMVYLTQLHDEYPENIEVMEE